jgi:hypothetical protein
MPFSRQNLIEELRQKGIFPLNTNFQADLKHLIITKFGFGIDDLNEEQLSEVEKVAKQINCKTRSRWIKSRRIYDVMLERSSSYFSELVCLSTFPTTKPPVKPGTSCSV